MFGDLAKGFKVSSDHTTPACRFVEFQHLKSVEINTQQTSDRKISFDSIR